MTQAPVAKNGNQTAPPSAVAPLTIEAALELIKQKAPEAFPVLSGVVRKDIVSLGTDDAFALRDQEGEIRAFKQPLTLSEKSGTLIQPVPGGPFAVSAQGVRGMAGSGRSVRHLPVRGPGRREVAGQPRCNQGYEERAYPHDLRTGGCISFLL